MTKYIAQRLLAGLLTAFIVSLLIFLIIRTNWGPEDYLLIDIGGEDSAEKQLEVIKEELGLNAPFHMQYLSWIGGWITGDWGESFFTTEDVWDGFKIKLPITLQLAAMAQAVAVLVGIPAGVYMALLRNSRIDILARTVSKVSLVFPIFLTGIILLVAGTHFLDWISEPRSSGIMVVEVPSNSLIPFLLSALTLGLPATAAVATMIRSATLETLRQDDVQAMAVSRPGRSTTVFLETLRYISVPMAVIMSLTFPAIVGGTVIAEWIFALDGAGHMLYEAMNQFDYAKIESLALFFAVWVIAVNTLVDIALRLAGPRRPPHQKVAQGRVGPSGKPRAAGVN